MTGKPQRLLPSFKKYMVFENLKNCILSNWLIHSDFECIINPITKEHTFISGCYFIECKNKKYSKDIQSFFNLEEYAKNLYSELKYIEEIEEKYLQNPIDYSNFNQEEFDNILKCEFCNCNFGDDYNDRTIILNEIVDKEKLQYILNNNEFDQEVNDLARNYFESLDDLGRKKFLISKNITTKIDIMEPDLV